MIKQNLKAISLAAIIGLTTSCGGGGTSTATTTNLNRAELNQAIINTYGSTKTASASATFFKVNTDGTITEIQTTPEECDNHQNGTLTDKITTCENNPNTQQITDTTINSNLTTSVLLEGDYTNTTLQQKISQDTQSGEYLITSNPFKIVYDDINNTGTDKQLHIQGTATIKVGVNESIPNTLNIVDNTGQLISTISATNNNGILSLGTETLNNLSTSPANYRIQTEQGKVLGTIIVPCGVGQFYSTGSKSCQNI